MENINDPIAEIDPDPRFSKPVSIPKPGGGHSTLQVDFRALGQRHYRDWLKRLQSETEQQTAIVAEVVAGWGGRPCTPEQIDHLLDRYPLAAQALVSAYGEGLYEEGEKN